MLHAPPLTERDQVHLVQPFVHRITEWTVEVAIKDVRSRHDLRNSQMFALQYRTKQQEFQSSPTITVLTREPGIRSKRCGM